MIYATGVNGIEGEHSAAAASSGDTTFICVNFFLPFKFIKSLTYSFYNQLDVQESKLFYIYFS